jgi:hypothetical protein
LKTRKVAILTEYYNNTGGLEAILESGYRPARPYRVYKGTKTAEARSARRRAIRRHGARDVVEILPLSDLPIGLRRQGSKAWSETESRVYSQGGRKPSGKKEKGGMDRRNRTATMPATSITSAPQRLSLAGSGKTLWLTRFLFAGSHSCTLIPIRAPEQRKAPLLLSGPLTAIWPRKSAAADRPLPLPFPPRRHLHLKQPGRRPLLATLSSYAA